MSKAKDKFSWGIWKGVHKTEKFCRVEPSQLLDMAFLALENDWSQRWGNLICGVCEGTISLVVLELGYLGKWGEYGSNLEAICSPAIKSNIPQKTIDANRKYKAL